MNFSMGFCNVISAYSFGMTSGFVLFDLTGNLEDLGKVNVNNMLRAMLCLALKPLVCNINLTIYWFSSDPAFDRFTGGSEQLKRRYGETLWPAA
jgi:hypothetical protein